MSQEREQEKILIMNMKTYRNFYHTMKKKSEKAEDPIKVALQFYETEVVIDENLNDGHIEVFYRDFYEDIMEKNGLDIIYAKNISWEELENED